MEPLALALMLTATACWASAQVIGKLVVRKMDVSVFNAIRPSIVAPMAILFAILTGSLANPGLKFIFAGALAGAIGWFGAVQLYFHLLKRGSAHKIIPIGNSHPLWGLSSRYYFWARGQDPSFSHRPLLSSSGHIFWLHGGINRAVGMLRRCR